MNSTALTLEADEIPTLNRSATPQARPGLSNHEDAFKPQNGAGRVAPVKSGQPLFKRVVLVAAIALAGFAGVNIAHDWWTVGRFMESTDDAYMGGDVTVIASKVSGFISQIAVADNQPVRAGDLLLKLDDRDQRAALAKAEASVSAQQAALANLEALRHLQEAVIAQAQVGVVSTDTESRRTLDDQIRAKTLVRTGALSAQDYDKSDADYKKAQADGERSRATLTAAQRQLEVIGAQKQQAQAALAVAVAERDLARLNVSYTELRAPMDGIVGNRSAQTGAYATTGSQLLSLVPKRGLWIDANFKENQVVNIHPGNPATVKVDLFPGRVFHGRVVSLSPATGSQFSVLPPENATGNFTKIVQRVAVRIMLDDATPTPGPLRVGLSVTAKVDTRSYGKEAL